MPEECGLEGKLSTSPSTFTLDVVEEGIFGFTLVPVTKPQVTSSDLPVFV